MKITLLPLGTVVLLKGGKKRIMITGYGPIDENGIVYDYNGCLYPEGVISSNETLLFNHDQLESLYFNGYFDSEALDFLQQAQPLIEQAKAERNPKSSESPKVLEPEVKPNIDSTQPAAQASATPTAPAATPVAPEPAPASKPQVDIAPHVTNTSINPTQPTTEFNSANPAPQIDNNFNSGQM